MHRQGLGSKFLASRQKVPIYRKGLPFSVALRRPEEAIVAPRRQNLPVGRAGGGKIFSWNFNRLAFTIH
jgi:hypothetical protein